MPNHQLLSHPLPLSCHLSLAPFQITDVSSELHVLPWVVTCVQISSVRNSCPLRVTTLTLLKNPGQLFGCVPVWPYLMCSCDRIHIPSHRQAPSVVMAWPSLSVFAENSWCQPISFLMMLTHLVPWFRWLLPAFPAGKWFFSLFPFCN